MGSYYNLLAINKRPPSLLLDIYPGASVAYSLRKLRTAYSGNCIRVRRSSDNAEQNIGFVGNNLDTTTMLDFVGYNMWAYSEEFNNALYVKTNINATGIPPYIDVEIAPDSTLTGDKIIENITSGSHSFRRETGTIINGASYNISVYLKQGERTSVEITSLISGTLQTCILDLTNGNISSNGFANTPIVTAEANGWYRFSVTITSGTTSQLTALRVLLRNASNQTSYLGDGISGVYIWGTQLSQTSTVKSYQKTVATAGGNGFVTTWYDQSTNANNSTQTTVLAQPKIVDAGILIQVNSKPSVKFENLLFMQTVLSINSVAHSKFIVGKYNAASTPISLTQTGVLNRYEAGYISTNTCILSYRNTADNSLTSGIYTTNAVLLSTLIKTATNRDLSVNTAITNTTINTISFLSNRLFINRLRDAGTQIYGDAFFSEVIIYPSDKSTDKSGIETNINSFYTIY